MLNGIEKVKFIIRLMGHLIIWFAFCLPLMLMGLVVIPIALLVTPRHQRKLPFLFRWWDNADHYIGRNTSVYDAICDKGFFARYQWLAIRNPINYVGYCVLGFTWSGKEIILRHDPKEDNIGDGTHPGLRYIEVEQRGIKFFEYYWIYQYPFAKRYCLRMRYGWKIGDLSNKPDSISQFALVFNPFHPYTGK